MKYAILILLILSVLALEIVLLVLTFAKSRSRTQWLRSRTIVRAIEFLLLLGIVLLPTTHMKWRYTGALILLGILLVIAGISWLIRRRKADSPIKKGKVIVSTILSVTMILFALVPAFLFTNYNGLETTGEYEISECSAILVDSSRIDPFEDDGSAREVPVHFFYPETEGPFPLVVFSHGAFGYYQSNYSTYAELASHGYIVAALDHPHHAFFTKDTSGSTVIADMQFMKSAIDVSNGDIVGDEAYALFRSWMDLRTADMNFVLDTVEAAKSSDSLDSAWHTDEAETVLSVLRMTDTEHIGVMGHSMGGATAAAMGRTRSDIDAVIVLDGTMLGEIIGYENGECSYNEEPYPVPILDFTKESDYIDGEKNQDNDGFAYVNDYEIDRAIEGKQMRFDHVGHMDFTDLPLFSPFLSKLLGSGDADKEAFMTQINGIVLNWFDQYLKGTNEPLC